MRPVWGAAFHSGEARSRVRSKLLKDAEAGLCRRAIRMGCLFDPDRGVTDLAKSENGRIDGGFLPFRPPEAERLVALQKKALLHGHVEHAGTLPGERDEDQAGGLAVKAVDDRKLRSVGNLIGEESAESIEEGGRVPRGGRVHKERGRLLDNNVVGGFRDDAEVRVIENWADRHVPAG